MGVASAESEGVGVGRRHVSGVKKKKGRGRRRILLCFDERKQKRWWAVVASPEAEVGLGEREA
jgi:hypothetical protein